MGKELWRNQEIECLECKITKGCSKCSIKKFYNIKDECYMFQFVLKKFIKLGNPLEMRKKCIN